MKRPDKPFFSKVLRDVGALLTALPFPHYCPGCEKEWWDHDQWFCEACWTVMESASGGLWEKNAGLKGLVTVAFHYSDAMREFIHQMKFGGRKDLARQLGLRSVERFREWGRIDQIEAVTPVPLHSARIRERGYDQNLTIASAVAEVLKLPVRTDLIYRKRNTKPQSRLSDDERRTNLNGVFAPESSVKSPPRSVLLIDDVIHTGHTVLESMLALRSVGVVHVEALAGCG